MDPLIAALSTRSPKAMVLLAERIDRLARVRHQMQETVGAVMHLPSLRRATQGALEAMDVHLDVLQKILRAIQAERWDESAPARVQSTWDALLAAQDAARRSGA